MDAYETAIALIEEDRAEGRALAVAQAYAELIDALRAHRGQRYGGQHVSFTIDRRLYEAAGLLEPTVPAEAEAAARANLEQHRAAKANNAGARRQIQETLVDAPQIRAEIDRYPRR